MHCNLAFGLIFQARVMFGTYAALRVQRLMTSPAETPFHTFIPCQLHRPGDKPKKHWLAATTSLFGRLLAKSRYVRIHRLLLAYSFPANGGLDSSEHISSLATSSR